MQLKCVRAIAVMHNYARVYARIILTSRCCKTSVQSMAASLAYLTYAKIASVRSIRCATAFVLGLSYQRL